jgi:hypothetical protein
MKRISKSIFVSLIFILVLTIINFNIRSSDPIIKKWAPKNDVAEMPIVQDTKPHRTQYAGATAPIEQRDAKYTEFLAASVKINVNGASGSGTICYYDPEENWAYVISCGHLWSGNKSYSKFENKQKAKIITWYQNSKKLDQPKEYNAEILFYSNTRGYDCSCLRFKPDWVPNYFPIAPIDYKLEKLCVLNSLGCDGGKEVARYEVEFAEYRGMDLITNKNSPRPGRSGGGLITDAGWYVGICWGTSDTTSGNGIGYFTPLKSIHELFIKNGHEWLIKLGEFSGRNIPIYDWQNPKNKFEWDFIPMPSGVKSYFTYFF